MRLMSPCNSTEPDAGKHMNQILFKCNFIWPVIIIYYNSDGYPVQFYGFK